MQILGRVPPPICEPEQRAKSLIPNQWLPIARDPVRESAHRDGDGRTATHPAWSAPLRYARRGRDELNYGDRVVVGTSAAF
jgi:hypothetical protein